MNRRGINEERAHKLSLLEKISQHRKKQNQPEVPHRRRVIIGLSDSEDDDVGSEEGYLSIPSESGDEEPTVVQPPRPVQQKSDPSIPGEFKGSNEILDKFKKLEIKGPNRKAQRSQDPREDVTANVLAAQGPGYPSGGARCDRVPDRSGLDNGQANLLKGKGDHQEKQQQSNQSVPNLCPDIDGRLFEHQKVGISWLWNLYKIPSGGILADDMGLGKTLQVSAFLSAVFASSDSRKKRVLIVAPKTLLTAWMKELRICGLEKSCLEYGGSVSERARSMQSVLHNGGIMITTYGMVQHNAESLSTHDAYDEDDGPFWDVLVMDEGHILKNPRTKTRKMVEMISCRMRLLITGTVLQNSFMEMHSLFDLVCPGLLGCAKDFKLNFSNQIAQGSDKHATSGDRERAAIVAESLRKQVAPYMLRREKKDVFVTEEDTNGAKNETCQTISKKKDFVVWLRLTSNQMKLYNAFLQTQSVRMALNRTASPLSALSILKKICDHPGLLSEKAQESINAQSFFGQDEDDSKSNRESLMSSIQALRKSDVLQEISKSSQLHASCKTIFVLNLVKKLVADGHRTLVFSQSRVMLDILEAALKTESWNYCRVDGSLSSQDRQERVEMFQTRTDIPVFLLTSQVGGLGLTLTAADRVIIVDPAWNPSVDSQSVDRAYRIGQKKDVIVYRLISCGTVEDKIYRKQVFKNGLFKTAVEDGEQFRYFSLADLKDLFRLDATEAMHSSTQKQLESLHSHERILSEKAESEIRFLDTIPTFVGLSDHDLLFSRKNELSQDIKAKASREISCRARTRNTHQDKSWSGSGQLSSTLEKLVSMSISNHSKSHEGLQQYEEEDETEIKRANLEASLIKQQQLLQNESVMASLRDGGEKIKAKIRHLESELSCLPGDNNNNMALGTQTKPEHTPVHAGQLELSQEPDTISSEQININEEETSIKVLQESSGNENITKVRQNIRRIKREIFDRATALDGSKGVQDSAEVKRVEELYREYCSLKDSLIHS